MAHPRLCGAAAVLALVCLPLAAQMSGRVVVAGNSPPEPAFVKVNCGGSGGWSGYSDKRGEFIVAFQLKNVSSGPANCQVEATLAGFTRGMVNAAWNQTDVILTLYPIGAQDSTVTSQDLAVPRAARKYFEKGAGEMRERRWESAKASLRKAIAAYPAYARAWAKLAEVLEDLRKPEEARNAYAKAIAIDARLFSAYAALSVLDANQERWDRVAATTGAAIHLEPVNWPVLYSYNAVANFNLGRLEEAEQSAQRAATSDKFPRAHYILGHILAARGDYRGAIEHMSKYLDLMPLAADAARVRAEIQDATSRQPMR